MGPPPLNPCHGLLCTHAHAVVAITNQCSCDVCKCLQCLVVTYVRVVSCTFSENQF